MRARDARGRFLPREGGAPATPQTVAGARDLLLRQPRTVRLAVAIDLLRSLPAGWPEVWCSECQCPFACTCGCCP